ncbi:MAG TPA: TIGR03089 family protein, partial [Nocardioides sp.]|nr:TIGR03089 family protein [Nocardioides sp.]
MTFSTLLAAQLRHEPGRPLLTWYDERTGERVELSVTTYANWVAKTASLLVDEHDLERGDVLLMDLPAHWLGPVFLGAAWTAGLAVAFPGSPAAEAGGLAE